MIAGPAVLIALGYVAYLALSLHSYGVTGHCNRIAERKQRRAAWWRAAGSTWEIAKVNIPPCFRTFHFRELRHVVKAAR